MRAPALAIASSVWWRHRRGLVASAAALLAMVIVYPLIFAQARAPAVVVASAVPLVWLFGYVLNALLFVEEAGSMSSSYPRHMLTLPVRTGTLVFWPMLYGPMSGGILWLVIALAIYGRSGFETPVRLPALAIAAFFAWCQALAWLPIKNPWLRATVTIGSLVTLGGLAALLEMLVAFSHARLEPMLIPYVIAYVVGLEAVRSDRRGDVWRIWPESLGSERIANRPAPVPRRRSFRSPARAQFSYEWNCHGLGLPLFVVAMMVVCLAFAFWGGRGFNSYQFRFTLATFLALPTILAGSTSSIHGRMRPSWVDDRRFITFLAIRPITSGGLVAAKFWMALVSALFACAIAALGTVFWVFASYGTPHVAALARDFFNRYPGGRGVTIVVLTAVLLPAVTWRLLTDWVTPSLTGRRRIAEAGAWLYLATIIVLASVGLRLMFHQQDLPRFYAIVPWLAVSAALFKVGLAIVTFQSTLRRRLLNWSAFWGILAVWLVLTGCAIGLATLLIPSGASPVSLPILWLGIATIVPLVRFPLATLALDWNRHR